MLTYRNKVFVAVMVIYICTAMWSIVQLVQHGFRKATSERFLLVFSIGRILCAGFQLATTNDPTNTSLWAGYVTTFSICVSLLISSALVLLKRLTQRAGFDFPKFQGRDPMKFCQILVTIGLVLGVIGGIRTNKSWKSTGHCSPDSLLKAGIVIFLISWAILVAMTIFVLSEACGAMLKRERLAVVAFGISLPLLLVRIVYSAISIFADPQSFSSITGSVTIMLCMALLEEMAVVLIYEGIGMVTLEPGKKTASDAAEYNQLSSIEVAGYPSK